VLDVDGAVGCGVGLFVFDGGVALRFGVGLCVLDVEVSVGCVVGLVLC
jgi:hypothetical protein